MVLNFQLNSRLESSGNDKLLVKLVHLDLLILTLLSDGVLTATNITV
jgi:hypothetical protein